MTDVAADGLGPLPDFLRPTGAGDVVAIVTPAGGKAWLVCDYALARTVLADERFSRAEAARMRSQLLDAQPAPDSMMSMDGPEHARLRRVVNAAFTTGRVAALAPSIERLTGERLDALAAAGPGADLIGLLATPLPLSVLCTLLGVPPQDHGLFRDWVDVLFDLTASTAKEKARRRLEITAYMADLIRHKRRWPKEDLLTDMIGAHDEGVMSMGELLTMGLTLLIAGYETTVGQIGLSVHSLLSSGAAYDDLFEPSAGTNEKAAGKAAGKAADELLRLTPSTPMAFPRVALEAVALGGVTVQPGEVVIVSLLHGNRDGKAFPVPERLNPGGHKAVHLTFGHGVHRCLGAPLARVQVRIVLARLPRRFPALRLANVPDAVVWKDGLSIRGLSRLAVEW